MREIAPDSIAIRSNNPTTENSPLSPPPPSATSLRATLPFIKYPLILSPPFPLTAPFPSLSSSGSKSNNPLHCHALLCNNLQKVTDYIGFHKILIFAHTFSFLIITPGGITTIATGSFSFEPNVWYHLKMEFIGSKIKCYVNGTKVIDTTDNSFSHGRAGFYVWHYYGETHFDNVVVTVYNITNLEPTASFTYTPEFPLASDIINFTDLSTDPDGSIVEWHWDFGDSTNETITTPPANTTHQYAAVGTYTITLTVTDNEGATNNVSKDIIVGVTLAEALDNAELNWTTGGDTKWFGQ